MMKHPAPTAPPLDVTTRTITADECAEVSRIIAHFASQAILLWRTPEDVARHVENFLLAEIAGRTIGCVAIQDYGGGLVEVRSLAVIQEYWGQGIGSHLIQAAIKLAAERGARRVFALTKRPKLFLHNGFVMAERNDFPQKVWNDCQLCPKRDHCIEVAVVHDLGAAAG
jgi:amino-acid N-acetyltransferase